MRKFTADFETAIWDINETWVWAWAVCEIGNEENIHIGTNIDEFIEFCKQEHNPNMYFHNLKFDGEFIIYWCLTHGFKRVDNKKDLRDNTFITCISDLGQFYTIEIYFKKGNKTAKKITFIDSLKIIPMSIAEIPKAFGFEINKLDLDYSRPRPKGYQLEEYEKEYIKHDVIIASKALNVLFSEGLDHITQASNALHDYKEIISKSKFEHFFPQMDFILDSEIRKSYKRWIYIS